MLKQYSCTAPPARAPLCLFTVLHLLDGQPKDEGAKLRLASTVRFCNLCFYNLCHDNYIEALPFTAFVGGVDVSRVLERVINLDSVGVWIFVHFFKVKEKRCLLRSRASALHEQLKRWGALFICAQHLGSTIVQMITHLHLWCQERVHPPHLGPAAPVPARLLFFSSFLHWPRPPQFFPD